MLRLLDARVGDEQKVSLCLHARHSSLSCLEIAVNTLDRAQHYLFRVEGTFVARLFAHSLKRDTRSLRKDNAIGSLKAEARSIFQQSLLEQSNVQRYCR